MPRRNPLPPKDDAPKIRHFLEHELTCDSPYRIERSSTWERARLYELSQQWLEPDLNGDDPTRSPLWKPLEVNEKTWMPMPVHNEMVAPIQNEVARLEGNGSRPYVRATDESPRIQRAAKLSRDALSHKLDELHWREIEHEGCHSMVAFGTWILKTYWDIDYTKTCKLPVTTAMKCPECDFRLSTPMLPREAATAAVAGSMANRVKDLTLYDQLNPLVPPKYKAAATHCLACDAVPPQPMMADDGLPATDAMGAPMMDAGKPVPRLEQYIPDTDEAKKGKDHYGRPLGEDVPIGDVGISNVSLWDSHLENQGVNIGWQNVSEWGEVRVVSLDWIANHYPKNAAEVQTDDLAEIQRWHPIIGGSRFINDGGSESGLFGNHCLLYEWHKEPWCEIKGGVAKMNRGRSLVMAGGVCLLDGDFVLDCMDDDGNPTGETIPRVHYEVIPWEIREKEAYGMSASELMFSQQDSVNMLISQVQDARHRFGSPKLLAREGMDLMYAGFTDTGYNSDIYYYRSEGDEQPIPFGNEQMDAQWAMELEHYTDSIQRSVGTMDVEIGGVPKDVTAASAMMFMGEKAGERRKQRIDRIREAKKRSYRHILQLMQEKYREEREYSTMTASDRRTVKTFIGADLMGQNHIEFEDEPATVNSRIFRMEAIKEAIKNGTIIVDTAVTRRKINRELGAPLDVNEEQNKQVERAIDEWLAFSEDGLDPAISVRGDDHTIHAQQHMLDLQTDEAKRIMDDLDWSQIELTLWDWDEDFDKIMAAEAMFKAQPLGDVPPKAMGPTDPATGHALGPASAEDQKASDANWQQQKAMEQQIMAMPRALELRIFEFQKGMLDKSGVFSTGMDPVTKQPIEDTERKKQVLRILRFRAHAEGHFRTSQKLATKAAMGAMMPSAPGGMETSAGTIPGSPMTARPGPGAGPGAATASGAGAPPA